MSICNSCFKILSQVECFAKGGIIRIYLLSKLSSFRVFYCQILHLSSFMDREWAI